MTTPTEMAKTTANMLLDIEAVNFRVDPPYKLTSGLASPVYIDCRKLISFPHVRSTLMDFAVERLAQAVGPNRFDAVAGGETAGIPFAAWIAERMDLPMLYVRKKPKGFGRDAQIEGDCKEGQNVLLVEDLTTDGGSKFNFINALKTAGTDVTDCFVIFFYDIFANSRQNLRDKGVELHALATWQDVLSAARERKAFDDQTLNQVEQFLGAPLEWSKANGGVDKLASA